ncbi:hypothetical protein ACWFNE_00580 [Cellulomonas sp. NPDC055163]
MSDRRADDDPRYRASDESAPLGPDGAALAASMRSEYELLVKVVSDFDTRLLTIKGWSVTLSLAALVLGFQHDHYALFGLAAVSALGFWTIDALTKTHQVRYYSRMRDIEVASFHLNRVALPTLLGDFSSPRIDGSWSYAGRAPDWRGDPPWRRDPAAVRRLVRRSWSMPHVVLPHVIAVVVGGLLFVAALSGVGELGQMQL